MLQKGLIALNIFLLNPCVLSFASSCKAKYLFFKLLFKEISVRDLIKYAPQIEIVQRKKDKRKKPTIRLVSRGMFSTATARR